MTITYRIRFMNEFNIVTGYHRGETGVCFDKRDAKIFQFREDAVREVIELKKRVQHLRPEIEVR